MPHYPPVSNRCVGEEAGQPRHDHRDWDRWLLAWRGPAYSIWFTARWASVFEARLVSGLLTEDWEQFEGCKTLEDIAANCHDHFLDTLPNADPLLFDGGIMALENGLTPESFEILDKIRYRRKRELKESAKITAQFRKLGVE